MKNATMCMVGLLMIVMLVGFGASAAAPAEPVDDWELEFRSAGQFLEEEDNCEGEHCHGQWDTQYLVVGSKGGAYTCYGDCEEKEDKPTPI